MFDEGAENAHVMLLLSLILNSGMCSGWFGWVGTIVCGAGGR